MKWLKAPERDCLKYMVHEAYMEVFPTDTIESRLHVLEPNSYVAVTCSPSKGVDETLDMTERLALRGFKVVPHVAAKMVRNKQHLRTFRSSVFLCPVAIHERRWVITRPLTNCCAISRRSNTSSRKSG
jgi:hypothetical protein